MRARRIDGVKVIGEARDGEEAVRLACELRPAVIFMDVTMPKLDGISATEEIKNVLPEARIIMFTSHNDETAFLAALCAGADGYCMKDATEQQLSGAINAVMQGAKWLDSSLANSVLMAKKTKSTVQETLKPQQKRILHLIDEGFQLSDIAGSLGMQITMVKLELKSILDQLSPDENTEKSSAQLAQLKALLDSESSAGRKQAPLGNIQIGAIVSGKYQIESLLGSRRNERCLPRKTHLFRQISCDQNDARAPDRRSFPEPAFSQ